MLTAFNKLVHFRIYSPSVIKSLCGSETFGKNCTSRCTLHHVTTGFECYTGCSQCCTIEHFQIFIKGFLKTKQITEAPDLWSDYYLTKVEKWFHSLPCKTERNWASKGLKSLRNVLPGWLYLNLHFLPAKKGFMLQWRNGLHNAIQALFMQTLCACRALNECVPRTGVA